MSSKRGADHGCGAGCGCGQNTAALGDLLRGLGIDDAGLPASLPIAGVTDDSRRVRPGFLFVARRGVAVDGAAFARAAADAGAAGVVADRAIEGLTAPVLRCEDAALAFAQIVERWEGEPSAAMTVVGVTGTNGKTTVSSLTRQILENAGVRTGMVSTVSIEGGDAPEKAVMTTPGAGEISRRLREFRERGCTAAVLETSSHALHQRRVAGVRYDIGVFTNLTGDHLDYHGDMNAYADAKAMLFEALPSEGWAIMNANDASSARMARECRAKVVACAVEGAVEHSLPRIDERATVRVVERTEAGMRLLLRGPFGELECEAPLVGAHNAMNVLQSACAAWAAGAMGEAINRAVASLRAPAGRLEPVTLSGGGQDISVFVDYAHTDDALGRALTALRERTPQGARLWVVFGCGGDRDATKRPRMGEVAARLADQVVITSDNPRTEDPGAIVEAVLRGARGVASGDRLRAEVDRERAIHLAVREASPGDVVLIAGKGHEDYQILPDGKGGTVRRDFDDRVVARAALEQRCAAACEGATR